MPKTIVSRPTSRLGSICTIYLLKSGPKTMVPCTRKTLCKLENFLDQFESNKQIYEDHKISCPLSHDRSISKMNSELVCRLAFQFEFFKNLRFTYSQFVKCLIGRSNSSQSINNKLTHLMH